MKLSDVAVVIASVGTLLTGIANLLTAIKKKPLENKRIPKAKKFK